MLSFKVPVPPVAKARPRVTMRGGYARAYTPKKSADFEKLVASLCPATEPMTGPLHLSIKFMLPIPKSWSKAKQRAAESGEIMPTSRPDIDNYVKAIMDSLNGIAYADDSQIVSLNAQKVYSAEPGIDIIVAARALHCSSG